MSFNKHVGKIKIVVMAILMSVAITSFSAPAPVYDADELDQSDGNIDTQRDVLPPPPQDQAYLPGVSHEASASRGTIATSSMSTSQRVGQLEQQVHNLMESSSSAHIESLQTQIQALRDQVEQLTHKLEQLTIEQKAAYTDIDARITKFTTAANESHPLTENKEPAKPVKVASAPKKEEEKVATPQPDVAEEQQIYQTAYTLIKDKKYNEAVTALQTMLKKYPSGQFASNAHYWLGELYGLLGKHDKSLAEFITVVTNYSKSPRVSDAQLKVGLIFASQSKWTEAKSAFKKVINQYPGTASARLASEQLKEIKKAGH